MPEDEWVDAFSGAEIADLGAYRQDKDEAVPASWQPRNLAEIEDKPPVEPTLGGLGIVYPGKRHVFSGPQESAKTLAAYVVGLQVVRAKQRVVLIDFEMGPWDAKTRLRELGASDDELAAFLYVEPEVPASEASTSALVVGSEPGLVIVDAAAGAYAVEGYDDNARKDAEAWANKWVTPFWRAGIATLVIDHVVKNVESRGNYAIGSGRKIEGVDVHLGFTVARPISRGEHGLYKVTTHKDRGGMLKRGHLCDFKLSSDPETHAISWEFVAPPVVDDEHPWEPTGLMEKVSKFLEHIVEPPVTTNTIISANLGKDQYVRDALKRLTERGFIDVTDGLNRSKLYESVVPFRENTHGASPVRPGESPYTEESGASVRPTPFRGDVRDEPTAKDEPSASRNPLLDP